MLRVSNGTGSWARAVGAGLGVWLFVSASAWPHAGGHMVNDLVVGALTVVFAAIAAYWLPMVRYFNMALAVWLLVTALVFVRVSGATVWNDVIVAVAMFVVSMIPNRPLHELRERAPD